MEKLTKIYEEKGDELYHAATGLLCGYIVYRSGRYYAVRRSSGTTLVLTKVIFG